MPQVTLEKGVNHFNMKNYDSVDSEIINFVLAEKYRKYSADGFKIHMS